MAASDASGLIISATCGAAFGFVQGFRIGHEIEAKRVEGGGFTGRQADITTREEFTATVTWLVPPGATPNAAPASLIIVVKKGDGASRTYTCAQMKPRGPACQHQNGDLEVWSQDFIYVGTFEANPLSIG
ncbi:MAG TPA: hypothetical protein VGP72_32050 [Planctomycetota bacterium]